MLFVSVFSLVQPKVCLTVSVGAYTLAYEQVQAWAYKEANFHTFTCVGKGIQEIRLVHGQLWGIKF